jgi:hypothetical protein
LISKIIKSSKLIANIYKNVNNVVDILKISKILKIKITSVKINILHKIKNITTSSNNTTKKSSNYNIKKTPLTPN